MQLYGALILCATLSAAFGLKCYTCMGTGIQSCTTVNTCSVLLDRCYTYSFSMNGSNVLMKGCQSSAACFSPMTCCGADLCNSAIPAGPSAVLLLVSSAILKLLF